jgi:aminoglycoside 6'-N-acetyltransferase I
MATSLNTMAIMAAAQIRRAVQQDAEGIAALCALLWPDASVEEHRHEVDAKIRSGKSGLLPLALFVAEDDDRALCGFIEVGLRSHADGCDTNHPVGYIEGWFVSEPFRGKGAGRALMQAAENWARENGCAEMASDALIDNLESQHAHSALGYEVVDRCVHFKKAL